MNGESNLQYLEVEMIFNNYNQSNEPNQGQLLSIKLSTMEGPDTLG